jgi:hypothetical protein
MPIDPEHVSSGPPQNRGTGRYGNDTRGYALATAAICLAIGGTPSPVLVGIASRGVIWGAAIPPAFVVVAATVLAASIVGGLIGVAASKSVDPIALRRARAARWATTLTLAIGIPVALLFGLLGDPG